MPKGQGLGRPVVLLLDHGVEKPSTILGFRVQYLQLSLGALPQPNMSPAFQQSPWFMELMSSAALSKFTF
jgi:hypothetical protein